VYETRGWYVPLQLNLQFGLLTTPGTSVSIFGGGNYVYGSSRDRSIDKPTNTVVFDQTARANIYGAQLGITGEKIFGRFGLNGFVMIQGLTGDVSYPNFTFKIRDTYILHGNLELIYLPFAVGLSLYHQRDFTGKGNVTSLNVTYKF